MKLNSEQWAYLEENYPGAYSYMLKCDLENELRGLQLIHKPNEWQQSRIQELTEWQSSPT